ncbi:guanine deaminase [Parahaliea maris]|uniref:Guanine deaminase n=1 Tax=Parahaliea maris TaxID=2716870 RepID=A0A5C9A363_9GAMM|nr:guanine deaminase [Parahaliea maris]TXS95313.1 guanine deaminase [Parahaliea maris]
MSLEAFRGDILHFLQDPDSVPLAESYQYIEDGLLLVEDGRVSATGPASALLPELPPGTPLNDYPGKLLCPGFVDTHIHYPQTKMVAAYGEQLLQWLETYTFPTEAEFADRAHAAAIAERFLDELLRCGTTTAQVFGTVHPESVDAFFAVAEQRNLRMICGKVLMDRNAPEALTDTAESGYQQSRELIERWHGKGRLRYAVTPRFAPTSTPEQLEQAGRLLREHPGVHLHTHLSENRDEVAWVRELFPDCAHYLDTYDQAGLLGRRSVFAHGIHLEDAEWQRLAETESNIAFCPGSNLFLGSGLFKLQRAVQQGIRVGLGTDIGAGHTFSILETMADAYKTQQLSGYKLTPFKAFYLATLGGASSLDCQQHIGNFEAGKEADFLVLDPAATPMLAFRYQHCASLLEKLFVLAMLGDDRAILATYIAGHCAHHRDDTDTH